MADFKVTAQVVVYIEDVANSREAVALVGGELGPLVSDIEILDVEDVSDLTEGEVQ